MIPMASTPKYIRLAGSPSLPIMPTPKLSQTKMSAAAIATPAAKWIHRVVHWVSSIGGNAVQQCAFVPY